MGIKKDYQLWSKFFLKKTASEVGKILFFVFIYKHVNNRYLQDKKR